MMDDWYKEPTWGDIQSPSADQIRAEMKQPLLSGMFKPLAPCRAYELEPAAKAPDVQVVSPVPQPTIVALYSPAPQSGKSSFVEIARYRYGADRVACVKFAQPLKQMLGQLLAAFYPQDVVVEMLDGSLKEHPIPELEGKTPRELMVSLGTEWGRNIISNDMWARAGEFALNKGLKSGKLVIVDDMRFSNEYDVVRTVSKTAWMVRIIRPGAAIGTGRSVEGKIDQYSFDATILNNGTYGEYATKVHHWLAENVDNTLLSYN